MSLAQSRRKAVVPAPPHVMRRGEISMAEALDVIGRRLFPEKWRSCAEPDPAADEFRIIIPDEGASETAQAAYNAFHIAGHEGPPNMITATREALAAAGVNADTLAGWERSGVVGRVRWAGRLDFEMSELLGDVQCVAANLLPHVAGVIVRNHDGGGQSDVPIGVWLRPRPIFKETLSNLDHREIGVSGWVVMPKAALDAAIETHFEAVAISEDASAPPVVGNQGPAIGRRPGVRTTSREKAEDAAKIHLRTYVESGGHRMIKAKAYEWAKGQSGCNDLSKNAFYNRIWRYSVPEEWRKWGRPKSKGVSDSF